MADKELLRRARNFFFAQKYRFDLGLQFLVFLNFALLILTASDKLKAILGLEHITEVILVMIPVGFVGAWAFGWFLDKVVHSPQTTERETVKRSLVWKENFQKLDEIDAELKAVRKALEKKK
ncbi:hypothetical protein H0O03_04440 [Candidatus Micrarchaeota archaeon]|nr:hypothetical protein [Candidatus Micrarchaeota archaeon]